MDEEEMESRIAALEAKVETLEERVEKLANPPKLPRGYTMEVGASNPPVFRAGRSTIQDDRVQPAHEFWLGPWRNTRAEAIDDAIAHQARR